jgi:DNA-binding response OmpR family regulator
MEHPGYHTEKPTTILLVDDEQRDLDTVGTILEDAGFTVLRADSSNKAMEIAARHRDSIDFLLTDIALPGMNGVELHQTLCEQMPALCNVLFISARSGSELLRFYGLAISDPHFLSKPFSAKQLVNRVHQLLETREPLHIVAS